MNIVILLSTYNGSPYLKQQLDSLFSQSFEGFEVFVRDDGSVDDTLKILSAYNITLVPDTKNLGSKKSFAALLAYAVAHSDADYFMFCDQDDVWHADKVEKTLAKMCSMEKECDDIPLLIHTDLEVVDECLNRISPSMWQYEYTFPDKNSFSRLLIQNTVAGCTVMINCALAKRCLNIPDNAIMHDWWMALVASHFGKVGFVEEATIKYRQHGKNTIGAKGFKVNVLRLFLGPFKSLFFRDKTYIGYMQVNIDQAKVFLETFDQELDEKNKILLTDFVYLNEKSFWARRLILFRHRLFKQGWLRNAAMFVKI